MADQKITQLTALTTADDADLLPIVEDPAGTAVTKKITVANLRTSVIGSTSFVYNEVPSGTVNGTTTAFDTASSYVAGSIQVYRDGQLLKGGGADYTETDSNTITFVTAPVTGSVLLVSYQSATSTAGNADTLDGQHGSYYAVSSEVANGWTSSSDTWVYASASTFTIAGVDRTSMFPTGTRLKFTQTTVKYAVVVSSSFSTNTTVTIAVNTDYTIANAAITSPYYSYQLVPQGYPSQFAFTPSWNNFTVGSATQVASFSLVGKMVTVRVKVTLSGSTMGTGPELIMPIPRNATLSTVVPLGWVAITDTGTAGFWGLIDGLGVLRLPLANSTYFGFDTVSATKPHTWANTDIFEFIVFYEAAG